MSAFEIRRVDPAEAELLAAEVERARAAGEFAASSDPEARFFLSSIELHRSPVAIAQIGAGPIVGFVSPEIKVVVVRPDVRRRGIGRQLVGAAVELERERGRPNVLMGVLPNDAIGRAFLSATGFAYHSTLWDLALPAAVPFAPPEWPAGLLARPFERGRDGRAFLQLFNASFATHPTPLQLDEAALDVPPEAGIEDEDTILLEDDAGALVGFCATSPERADGVVGPHAEIWTIGVRPDMQGRGLGRQLLRWGVGRLRAIGARDLTLSVNGLNEHALWLYESEGFRRTATRERWARPVL